MSKNNKIFIEKISLYLNEKPLTLDESIDFLNLIRELTLDLISKKESQLSDTGNINNITYDLLGFILKIPRMNEHSSETSENKEQLAKAVKQIDQINQSTEVCREYLKNNIQLLKNYYQ
ncbi:MAG: hypothetical protein ACRCTQ_01525 [Brevinemataceae bacterium]